MAENKKTSLLHTLIHLKGNARAAVYTEIMWGIPFSLLIPYLSLYMKGLGATDTQVGLIATIGLLSRMFFTFFSGYLTDRFGRLKTLLFGDIFSWSLTALIWAVSRNVWFFYAAAVTNGVIQISMNAWTCIVVEDTPPDKLVRVWSLIHIGVILSALAAPISAYFVKNYTVVPTMRVLTGFAFLMMTAKFIIQYKMSRETETGIGKMEESRRKPFQTLFFEAASALVIIFRTPYTLMAILICAGVRITVTIQDSFWSIFVKEGRGVAEEWIGWFSFIRASVMFLTMFTVVPLITRKFSMGKTLGGGFLLMLISSVAMAFVPQGNTSAAVVMLALISFVAALSLGILNPVLDTLLAQAIDPENRAKIFGLVMLLQLLLVAPFGYISGRLSSFDKWFPFMLIAVITALMAAVAYRSSRLNHPFAGE